MTQKENLEINKLERIWMSENILIREKVHSKENQEIGAVRGGFGRSKRFDAEKSSVSKENLEICAVRGGFYDQTV